MGESEHDVSSIAKIATDTSKNARQQAKTFRDTCATVPEFLLTLSWQMPDRNARIKQRKY